MAIFKNQVVITIDPSKPVEEIGSIIGGILKFHPGREIEILHAVKGEMDKSIPQFEASA